jgi:RND family efflux transporter MFP subunit
MISAALVALALSCSENESVELQGPAAVSVNAVVVHPSSHTITNSFTGTLEGEQQSDIYARIAEAVERVLVREGEQVKEGQVLIALDKSGPTSNYRHAESIYLNAEKNYRKMEFLFKEGAVSESQYDAARTEYEVSKANYEAASRLVEVRSPVTGVVTSLDVARGDYLHNGQKLATIASLDRLRVTLGVNARDVSAVREGDTVFVSSSEIAASLPGEVVAVARSADPVTRAFDVEVSVANKRALLHPGMFVRVSLVLDRLNDVVVAPHEAVVELDNVPTVFVINDGVAHKRPITPAAEIEAGVVISDGLQVGDTLVTLGQTYLDEGFDVKIIELESNPR